MKNNLKTATLCIHAGHEPKNGEPRQLPIIQSTTFKYDNTEEMALLFDLKKEGYFWTCHGESAITLSELLGYELILLAIYKKIIIFFSLPQ